MPPILPPPETFIPGNATEIAGSEWLLPDPPPEAVPDPGPAPAAPVPVVDATTAPA